MNSVPIIKSSVAACLSMLLVSVGAQAADDAAQTPQSASASVSDLAVFKLNKQSFELGLAYTQATFKTTHANIGTQITDNGAPSPIIELRSSEKILKAWPMRVGNAVVGWDINASASIYNTRYQILNSALRGQDIGTNVSGGYIGVAPILFFKMGPLYPGSELYLKVGGGIGPGMLKSSGTSSFNGTVDTVGSSSPVFAIYRTASWQFQAGNWYFDILGKGLQTLDGTHTSLESYGFGVAYRIGL